MPRAMGQQIQLVKDVKSGGFVMRKGAIGVIVGVSGGQKIGQQVFYKIEIPNNRYFWVGASDIKTRK